MTDKIRFFEGKKFLWDGEEYDSKDKARSAEKEYRGKGFEVQTWTEDGKVFLYTRRVVTEVVVEEG
jgi:hypothetical protein